MEWKRVWRVAACVAAVAGPLAGVLGQERAALPAAATLAEMPTGSQEIGGAMSTAKAGSPIVLRGRMTPGRDVFASDVAEFVLADDAASGPCFAKGASESACVLPPGKTARIRVCDAAGKTLGVSLAGKAGFTPGSEVFVVGTVQAANGKDELVVRATGVHTPRVSPPPGWLAREQPAAAQDVSGARKGEGAMRKGERVTLRGRIGGSMSPLVDNRAMFTLVGSGVQACNAVPGDGCKTPWDYCCETREDITANSATVRLVDAKGALLRTGLKGRAGIKELSEVIVSGVVSQTGAGVLIVDADSIWVANP